jgi:hypothetical protein
MGWQETPVDHRETLMRRFALAALFVLTAAVPSRALERWETLPPTPAPIATDRSGTADANGIKIAYAIYGQGSPVIFLHGGLANSDYWAIRFLRSRRATW